MSKTTLSPIIAGTMNWEFGIKPNIKGNAMIHVCLENKITTLTMPIFTVVSLNPTRKSICFKQNSERKSS
jgi:hypothetical protein